MNGVGWEMRGEGLEVGRKGGGEERKKDKNKYCSTRALHTHARTHARREVGDSVFSIQHSNKYIHTHIHHSFIQRAQKKRRKGKEGKKRKKIQIQTHTHTHIKPTPPNPTYPYQPITGVGLNRSRERGRGRSRREEEVGVEERKRRKRKRRGVDALRRSFDWASINAAAPPQGGAGPS